MAGAAARLARPPCGADRPRTCRSGSPAARAHREGRATLQPDTTNRALSWVYRTVPCSIRHDGGSGDVTLVLLREGLVDLLERILVRDHATPRVLVESPLHELEGAAKVLSLVVGEP